MKKETPKQIDDIFCGKESLKWVRRDRIRNEEYNMVGEFYELPDCAFQEDMQEKKRLPKQ